MTQPFIRNWQQYARHAYKTLPIRHRTQPLTSNWQQYARYACETLPIRAEPSPSPATGSNTHGMRAKRCQFGETSPVTVP